MRVQAHTFSLDFNWKLVNEISRIDRFDASWSAIEKKEGQSLKQLKSIATVHSVGASTRIEGSKMTDEEVETLIKKLSITRMEERDAQEVMGYYEALDTITQSYGHIEITESGIKNLHNILLKYCEKDKWHRGNYKQHSNAVEARYADGSREILFNTTAPGFATDMAMQKLLAWYDTDRETHALVRIALWVYDFLSIHPFQDGNGRMSRLLTTLLLLRNGYKWIQYISFEHEIEKRKAEYYKVLMQCQQQRPGEDVTPWLRFFFDCLLNLQALLMRKLQAEGNTAQLSPRDKKVYVFIESHPGCSSGEIAKALDIPLPTVKKLLATMFANNLLIKHGQGKGTHYTVM